MVYTKWLSRRGFLVFFLGLSACQTVEYTAADKPEYQWEFKVLQGKEVILLARWEGGLLGGARNGEKPDFATVITKSDRSITN